MLSVSTLSEDERQDNQTSNLSGMWFQDDHGLRLAISLNTENCDLGLSLTLLERVCRLSGLSIAASG